MFNLGYSGARPFRPKIEELNSMISLLHCLEAHKQT